MFIQPTYMRLWDLLNGRLFRIPAYQRAYSWEKKHRSDLFDDILRLRHPDADATHFMATMVGLSRGKKVVATDELQEIEVVDGQQRLTTLILLLKALSKGLDRKHKPSRIVASEIDSLLVKDDSHSLLLLQTNHDRSEYFADYIRSGKYPAPSEAKTLADRLLLSAMQECEAFVRNWGQDRLALAAILKNRLTIILHEISDELVVYTVFEVLNSRGLDVAWLDRLKSILMGVAFERGQGIKMEAVEELHRVWGDIYACVGLHQGRSAEALRFAATLKSESTVSRVLSQEDSVDALRELTGKSARGAIDVSKWVLSVVKAVDRLITDNRRAAVTKIAHARLLAVALELREDLAVDREVLLAAWENATFRIFGMCRKDARTRVGDYVRLAHSVMSTAIQPAPILARIRVLGAAEFGIEFAVEALRDTNCYEGWEEELLYFMYRYEEFLAERNGQKFKSAQWSRIWEAAPAQSIEHIWPQSAGIDMRATNETDIFTHRLGNLVLLPPRLNSTLSARKPKDKVGEYEKTGLLIVSEVVPALGTWSAESVRNRENALLAWARQEWADSI
jgi:hypothetical protein